MRRQFLIGSLAATAVTLTGCEEPKPAPPPPPPPAPPPPPPVSVEPERIDWVEKITPENVPDTARVSVITAKGEIIIELNGKAAPITVSNFLRYVESGKLTGSDFWRAANYDGVGFIQCTMRGPTFPPIRHEPTSQTGLSHTNGALSMSRFDPGTATADFIICVGDNTAMDAGREGSDDKLGYAVFGRVVKGMGVVRAILAGKISKAKAKPGQWDGQMLAPPMTITEGKRIDSV
ncbi:peptidyl-prolyl cis-trans isomerase A [Asticcacaulis biprosthecium C19]|uniref:peptidylprolyl isomerase n=1 Tax=Asticcacaulis biprosthecium C19 TaxID=715226 RepID=F4QMN1_9CAUL|nr:peptidylprolyl isomerase [Asticcacaulis biprosthecium]EGF91472.1 peptidyl-prolyl cis-trans isomerase A [Asticcacaulis biprosthecium C19]